MFFLKYTQRSYNSGSIDFLGFAITTAWDGEPYVNVRFSVLNLSSYVTHRGFRLLWFDSRSIGHTDLTGRSLLAAGTTDGKPYLQILFLTIFF